MTTNTLGPDHVRTEPPTPGHGIAARRWVLISCPVLAGLCALTGALADPAAGISGERLYQLYGDHPEPLQVKALAYHWSYAFWMVPALLILPYVRGRGTWLANVGALAGFAGLVTLPGLVFVDFYDSAIAQEFGVSGAVAVEEQMTSMWGVPVFALPGIIGLVVALPLAALALWRAGLVRWWAPACAVAGFAASTASNSTWWGFVVLTALFTGFAVALAQATRQATLPKAAGVVSGPR